MAKINITARRNARSMALQALYQWVLAGADLSEIEQQFCEDFDMKKVEMPYFRELLHELPKHLAEIDALYVPYLDRDIKMLNPIELITIRMGVFELAKHPEIPYKVAINEALELNKAFGAEEGYKYVNGVLDKVARQLRSEEIKAAGA
ncbi:MAG: transcription antitermination factor NusB, partial [Gammaproteobacteria bacterium]